MPKKKKTLTVHAPRSVKVKKVTKKHNPIHLKFGGKTYKFSKKGTGFIKQRKGPGYRKPTKKERVGRWLKTRVKRKKKRKRKRKR